MFLGTKQNHYVGESKRKLFNLVRKTEFLNESMSLLESHRYMKQVAQFTFTSALTMTDYPTQSKSTNRLKMTQEKKS